MLREENKRAVRVRVCGDLARFMDDEEWESVDEFEPALIPVVIEQGRVIGIKTSLSEESEQAA